MKLIKDPIHGDVSVQDENLPLLDCPQMQRLRRIRQIGLGSLVYPGANHTRFEHSLGTMHIAGELADRMGLDPEDRRKMTVSALLHDIGHGPFSHTSEKFAMALAGIDHSRLTENQLLSGGISDILGDLGMDPTEIAAIASGADDRLGLLLHSEIGVDRMDYLMRDAHYTGVAYGVIDYERIVGTLVFHGGQIAIREKGIQAAESLLVARFLMYPAVYLHHVSRIADAMMLRALEELVFGGSTVEEIMAMDDMTLMALLVGKKGLPGQMGRRILDRDLYKRAIYLPADQVKDREHLLNIANERRRVRSLEDEIATTAGLGDGFVLVDIPREPPLDRTGIRIVTDGKIQLLEERSAIVRSLTEAEWNYWRFGVYCPGGSVDRVKEVCASYGWR